jgi:predicted methyltransferase
MTDAAAATGPLSGRPWTRRHLFGAGAALSLAAGLPGCSRRAVSPPAAAAGAPATTLPDALAGAWRSAPDRKRDAAAHPQASLKVFGLVPSMSVLELWPGAGYWTSILAPYLKTGGGRLVAATFETPSPEDPAAAPVVAAYTKMLADRPDLYGAVQLTRFGPHTGPLAAPGTIDLALIFNLDALMAAGLAEKALRDVFSALKPQGALGVLQARAPAGGAQDPLASNGRVQEAFVRALAAEAGFRTCVASEVNADPRDAGAQPPGAGPADRMTLKFLKSGSPAKA